MAAVAAQPSTAPRKKLVRRAVKDRAQVIRRGMQLAFLALNVWIAVEFWLFVRYYETGGRTVWASRPPGVEGWLPIASLMNLKVLLYTGDFPALHPAGMFLLLAFLTCSWIFRKSFCGWLCPIGTIPSTCGGWGARRSAELSGCLENWTSRCAASSTSCWRCSCTRWFV